MNPLAGIGGRVGLKGSDGEAAVRRAFELGAVCLSPRRAAEALGPVAAAGTARIEVVTYPGSMGEEESLAAGFRPTVLGAIDRGFGRTSADDTRRAAADMLESDIDLLLFAGGDGTARDIYDVVGDRLPVLGIPSGCKIHSGVFAATPRAAGELTRLFFEGGVMRTTELEVMDIDEEAFRHDELRACLYGYLRVPFEPRLTQGSKVGGRGLSEAAAAYSIAERVVEDMRPGRLYLIGSGTTPRGITQRLGLANTLLGVDVVRDGRLVASDAAEGDLLALLGEAGDAPGGLTPRADAVLGAAVGPVAGGHTDDGHTDDVPRAAEPGPDAGAEIVVTPVGGQGFIFGRGNQQLSPEVIRRVGVKNVRVIATPAKLVNLPFHRMRVDTGDPEVDDALRGYRRVITGYRETAVVEVV
ncbi:MAG: ATP-NAD kinase family protein [Thermoleophilia bacterium]